MAASFRTPSLSVAAPAGPEDCQPERSPVEKSALRTRLSPTRGGSSSGGAGSVGVPGTIPGLIEIHKRYGSLPFSVLVEQSVHLAKKGSVTSKNQEYLSGVLSPVISNSPELLSLFKKDGSFLRAGERFFNKELGLFLEQFLYEDPTVFYKNEVCPLFYDTISEGGIISLKDLQDYTPKKRKPLAVKYRGCDIFMNPKPSTGGVLILSLIHI